MEGGVIHRRLDEIVAAEVQKERQRCAEIAGMYPIEMFSYDGDTGELLRLRDDISQSILKGGIPGRMVA